MWTMGSGFDKGHIINVECDDGETYKISLKDLTKIMRKRNFKVEKKIKYTWLKI